MNWPSVYRLYLFNRVYTSLSLLLSFIFILLPNLLSSQSSSIDYETLRFQIDSQMVSPGLFYYHYRTDIPWSIHLLKVDLSQVRLDIQMAMDQLIGQESTSSMVSRKGAIAGVNGGFSFSNAPWNLFHGDPKDFFLLYGQILSEPYSSRSSLGIVYNNDKQKIIVDQIQWKGQFCNNKQHCLELTGINRKRGNHDLVLYTPDWNRSTLTKAGGMEFVINNSQLRRISIAGSTIIPSLGFVISASGNYVDSLSNVTGQYYFVTHDYRSLLYPTKAVSVQNTSYHTAGPIIMLNGKPEIRFEQEQIPVAFVEDRHPRTAVGISRDETSLFIMVVDGRQDNLSIGMNLYEVASFLRWLGAYTAYNLDGGGSSTMVIDDKVVNSPSDGKERRRCDALLLFEK